MIIELIIKEPSFGKFEILLSVSFRMSDFQVPDAKVSKLSPKGFEVSIPHKKGITLFAFHGQFNEPIRNLSEHEWAADIIKQTDGRWVYTNKEKIVEPGDTLYYWLTVRVKGVDYHAMHQTYKFGQKWRFFLWEW